jgi:hypothetical protein
MAKRSKRREWTKDVNVTDLAGEWVGGQMLTQLVLDRVSQYARPLGPRSLVHLSEVQRMTEANGSS